MRQHSKTTVMAFTVLMMLGGWRLPADGEVGVGLRGGMLLPDQNPFKAEFDASFLIGGVVEFDSNIGPTLEASVERYAQNSNIAARGGDISIVPIMLAVKYSFLPRYRTSPFVGLGVGSYFFNREYVNGTSISKTRFGARVSLGIRFFQDRVFHLIFEGARNFVDFEDMNASSYQFTATLLYNFSPTVVAAPY